jgi:hypothetical protein
MTPKTDESPNGAATERLPEPKKTAQIGVTHASAWKKASEPELIRLPNSGHIVRAQRRSMLAMAAKLGHVPNPLSAEVMRLLAMGQPSDEAPEARQVEIFTKNALAFLELFALTILEPKLIIDRDPDYAHGEIAPSDIYDADLIWLYFTYLEGSVERVTPFRVA